MADSEFKPEMSNRDLWIERAKTAGVLLFIAALIGGLLLYEGGFDDEQRSRVHGTVVGSVPVTTSSLAGNSQRLQVKLDDGRQVEVLAGGSRLPEQGAQISIVEHRHSNGRVTYTLPVEAVDH